MRTLVNAMTHLRTPQEGKMLRVWQELFEWCNGTHHDLLLVDSMAPHKPIDFLWNKQDWKTQWLVNDEHLPALTGHRTIAAFHNALGHPFHDAVRQGSGSDRAWMKGIEIAIANNYDRYVYLEMDLLYARSVEWAFGQMQKPVGCGPLVSHGKFPEVGMFFAHTEHLWKTDFVGKYNWRGPCVPEGERRMWDILGDSMQLLPIKGCRDGGLTRPEDLARNWPDGIDWLTHATVETNQEFLKLNGFPHLAEMLA